MPRPDSRFRPSAERVTRARTRLADLALPGGLDQARRDAADAVPVPEPTGAVIERLTERTVPLEARLVSHGPLFRELVGLISDDEEAELLAAVEPERRAVLEASDPLDRRASLIGFGLSRGLLDLPARTGLSGAIPPVEIHAMSHVDWSAGGDPWYADMIATAFEEAGRPLVDGSSVLDFGCSSGRVVRMLAARRPGVQWHGCDVNADAVDWATEALPAISFATAPLRPPLPYADASFDGVFAISIWSHYAEEPARIWLDELHRIVKPGGVALITTHGDGAVAYRAAQPGHGEEAQRGVLSDLYRSGFCFVDAFGGSGDWGVVDSGWGVSFISPEWLLREITPKWSVALYRPAAIDSHQDLWMLRREA